MFTLQASLLVPALLLSTAVVALAAVYLDSTSALSIAVLVLAVLLWFVLLIATCTLLLRTKRFTLRYENLLFDAVGGDEFGDNVQLVPRTTIPVGEYVSSLGFY